MAKYIVDGRIEFWVEVNIEATSKLDAEKKAKEMLNDMYSLDCFGAYHDPKRVEYKLDSERDS